MSKIEMVDVGGKAVTVRRALARGSIRMGGSAFGMLRDGVLPKGDPLSMANVAGILAAKKTSELIPLCHPLPLDSVTLRFELDADLPGVHAFCEARATAKTGVEMEALAGVSTALLTIYDVVKQVDAALTIESIRLETKEGGKSGTWQHPESFPPSLGKEVDTPLRGAGCGWIGAVITVSDRCSKGEAVDLSGPALAQGLKALGFEVGPVVVVPDEREKIGDAILSAARTSDVVALTGGTGLSPRDVTPEAVASVCDRLIPGIGEVLRAQGKVSTPMATLSRSVAGQLGKTLVVALPGSKGGVKDGLRVLAELLPHALHIAKGGAH